MKYREQIHHIRSDRPQLGQNRKFKKIDKLKKNWIAQKRKNYMEKLQKLNTHYSVMLLLFYVDRMRRFCRSMTNFRRLQDVQILQVGCTDFVGRMHDFCRSDAQGKVKTISEPIAAATFIKLTLRNSRYVGCQVKTFIVRPTYRIECNQLKKAVQLTYSRSDTLNFFCASDLPNLCIRPTSNRIVHPTYN